MNKTITPISCPSLLAEGSRLLGNLTFMAEAQVFSTVEGEILQQSLEPLTIGKGGWIYGSISAEGPVVIEGRVEGNVYSKLTIRVTRTGYVRGTLVGPNIEVEAGAQVEGEFIMHWKAQNPRQLKKAA